MHIEFKNQAEYLDAKLMVEVYDKFCSEYRTIHKTNGIPIDICKLFPYSTEVTNELRSAIETFEFVLTPPKKYTVYVNESTGEVTTWTGQKLGRFQVINGFRSNFRDYRICVRIKAINGKSYYGIYFKSIGNYARIKMNKNETI